jgi:hypothetical protein
MGFYLDTRQISETWLAQESGWLAPAAVSLIHLTARPA